MANATHRKGYRILSAVLAVVMLLSLMPTSLAAGDKDPKEPTSADYTVLVTDKKTNAPIKGAKVTYSVTVDGEAAEENVSATTNDKGVAQLTYLEDLAQEALEKEQTIQLKYAVEAADYAPQPEQSLTIEELSKQITVQMEYNKAVVSIAKEGSGTVTVNGKADAEQTITKGTEITVVVTPDKNGEIKSVKIGGEEQTIANADQPATFKVTVNGDLEIKAAFHNNYQITAQENGGKGEILVSKVALGEEPVLVEGGKEVSISVTAPEDFVISALTIGGQAQKLTEYQESFKIDKYTVRKDTVIAVTYAPLYTITINYDAETGAVETEPDCKAGVVKLLNGKDLKITATPKEHYRVASIQAVSNGKTENLNGENMGVNEKPVTVTLKKITRDYTVTISFVPNQYQVTAKSADHGKVTFKNNQTTVDHGQTVSFKVVPDSRYTLDSITVRENGKELDKDRFEQDGDYTVVKNVQGDIEVEASFVSTSAISFSDAADLTIENEVKYDKNNAVVVLKNQNDARVIITPKSPYEEAYFVTDKEEASTISDSRSIKSAYAQKTETRWFFVPIPVDVTEEIKIGSVLKYVVKDDQAPTVEFTAEEQGTAQYSKDFSVSLAVEDPLQTVEETKVVNSYSGITSVVVWVTADGEVTQPETTLFSNVNEAGETTEAPQEFNGNLIVNAASNNSDNVVVHVRVTDAAGNTKEYASDPYQVNLDAPHMTITVSGTKGEFAAKDLACYNQNRVATITIEDRESSLNPDGLVITDGDNKNVRRSWDGNVVTFTFAVEKEHDWTIKYTNKAGLSCEIDPEAVTGNDPFQFTLDKTAPTAELKVEGGKTFTKLMQTITFGLIRNRGTAVSVVNEKDELTGIQSVLFYKDVSTKEKALGLDALNQLYRDGQFQECENNTLDGLDEDEIFVVYARIADNAGNVLYLGSNGVVVDTTASLIEAKPSIEPNENGYYTKDFTINVSVNDQLAEDAAYSGIKNVKYKIFVDGKLSGKEETLFEADLKKEPSVSDFVKAVDGKKIDISTKQFNSDDILVVITAEDNAGNQAEKVEIPLMINTTPPTAVLSFEPNTEADTDHVQKSYFNVPRVATLVITDRSASFDQSNVKLSVTALDVNGDKVKVGEDEHAFDVNDLRPEWTSDGSKHTLKLHFDTDANYEWSVAYQNKAGLDMGKVEVAKGTNYPYEFTVDQTAPTGGITIGAVSESGEPKTLWDWVSGILNKIGFGKKSNSGDVSVSAYAEDSTSSTVIEYYQYQPKDMKEADNGKDLADQLDALYKAGKFTEYKSPITVSPEAEFLAYLRITDAAGNHTYVNSEGVVVDSKASEIEQKPAEKDNEAYGISDDKQSEDGSGVKVDVSVTDAWPHSGIKQVDYVVENNGAQTQSGTLYSDPENENRASEFNGAVYVDPARNNSSNVVVRVTTIDHAGNTNELAIPLDIDVTAPTIKADFAGKANPGAESGYYVKDRTATVTYTERTNHFSEDDALKGIKITAKDLSGKDIADAWSIKWSHVEDQGTAEQKDADGNVTKAAVAPNPDKDRHIAVITFEKDANYTFDISYEDKAGNANEQVVYTGDNCSKFTVDTVAPDATVTAKSDGREDSWQAPVDETSFTFGFWAKNGISISQKSSDVTSPIQSVKYYMPVAKSASDLKSGLTADELSKLSADVWKDFSDFTVTDNQQFVVYLKVTDNAGNVKYVGTNGLIVDKEHPVEEVAPEISVNPQKPVNGIYKDNFTVAIKVEDPLVGGTYSGLKEVRYAVYNRGGSEPNKATQDGVLYTFKGDSLKQADLKQVFEQTITVDAAKNNSNDVQIIVYAVDNAGNTSDTTQSNALHAKVDTTAPKIQIRYDNNSADSGTYFRNARTARIAIVERNFRAEDVKIKITNTDGTIPAVVGWTTAPGVTANGDDTTHIATIKYAADGDYTFDISYTDLAGNASAPVAYDNGTVAATAFTVDNIDPKVTVSYNNTSAQNGNYYKDARTATVVINEHNLDPNGADKGRVVITMTATNDGANAAVPAVSTWRRNGDTHTATITYSGDARYTFDIKVTDKAGRVYDAYNGDTFFVDKTAPKLEITGVANNSANRGDIIPVVTYSDTNYDANQVRITLDGASRGDVKLDGGYQDIHNGRRFTFRNFPVQKDVDDIYTLTATLTDKAGNRTTQTIRFSANRFGSAYEMSKATKELNGTYVRQADDVVMTEVNPDKLDNIKLTMFKNNKSTVLKEGRDYRMTVTGGNGEWYKYVYTIFNKNFEEGGVYRITFHSEDAAGNVAENTLETKGAELGFGIDQVNPTVSVLNVENGKTYNLETMDVNMTANDDLKLQSVVIYLDGEKYRELSEDELDQMVRDGGNYTFPIDGDSTEAHTLSVVATDAAGNQYVEEVTDFYVTTNPWVRFRNNKPLFFGSIAGVLAVAAGLIFFIVAKRRDDDEEEEQTTAAQR